jgi:LytR cell envelope-related transcriptional attenuator/LytR_cpsA_psr family
LGSPSALFDRGCRALGTGYAVSLNFDQFANIVQALGGIDMAFPESLFDLESGLNVQASACVHLSGVQALQVVRARHLQYDPPGDTSTYAPDWPPENLSDLARIRRDHEFLRVLATTVAKTNLADPVTDLNLINSLKNDITFDQTWSVNDMVNLMLDSRSVDINSVPQLTLPVSTVYDPDGPKGSYIYEGTGPYGDVVFPSEGPDQGAIDQVLGVDGSTDTMTGQPLPSPGSVSVSVMTGSGIADQATTASQGLAALGFKVAGVGHVPVVADVAETVVYYGSLTANAEAAAETVARSMGGSVIMGYDPAAVTDGAEVTVVTGTDFSVNPPTAPVARSGAVGSKHPTGSTTSTSTTTPLTNSTGTSDVQPPSPSTSPLQPWDPRACPRNATPSAPVPNQT